MSKYRVSELASILGITEQAIRSKIKRNILPSTLEDIGGRSIVFIPLSDNELEELLSATNRNKNIYSSAAPNIEDNTQYCKDNIGHDKIEFSQNDKLFAFMDKYADNLREAYIILGEKEKIIAQQNAQIYLLEDSEKRKEHEYLRQISELKTENERLQRHWWKIWQKGK